MNASDLTPLPLGGRSGSTNDNRRVSLTHFTTFLMTLYGEDKLPEQLKDEKVTVELFQRFAEFLIIYHP